MKRGTQSKGLSALGKLLFVFIAVILLLGSMLLFTVWKLNQEAKVEKQRHINGNYTRVESMMEDFEHVKD